MIKAGLGMDEEKCLKELEEVIDEFSSNYEHHFDKLLLRLPRTVIGASSPLVLVAAGMIGYHDTKFHNLKPYEDAIAVLRVFKERNMKMGIISAGIGIKQAEKVVRLGLNDLISPQLTFITDSIGISKANPKLFLRACEKIGAKPKNTMYVGDNPSSDVDIPHEIGMITVLSKRSGKHSNKESKHKPDHIIHNFWDLLDLIDTKYQIAK
jgi:putative hydrolase of the HAD superfamily